MGKGDKIIIIRGFYKGIRGVIKDITKDGKLVVGDWILDPFDVELLERDDLWLTEFE